MKTYNNKKGSKNPPAKRPPLKKRFLIWAVTFLLIAGVGSVLYSQSGNRKMNDGQDKTYVPTRAITRDASTGKLRKPNAQETKELVSNLKEMTKRSTEGLTEQALPNGAVAVNLEGRFGNVMLARENEDGTTEVKCVTTFEEGTAFLGLVEKAGGTNE